MKTWVGLCNHVLDGGADPPRGGAVFSGRPGHSKALAVFTAASQKDHLVATNIMPQKGSFSMLGSANSILKITWHRRCVLAAKGVVGLHSMGKV